VTSAVIRFFERFMPEPFAFAVLMTFIGLALVVVMTPASPVDAVLAWGNGLSGLLPFITQVCLTVLFAFALAHLGPIPALLQRVASVPGSARGACAFAVLFAGAVSLIAWPLGTILGGLMARELAESCKRRGIRVHYPLLGGAAFSGYVVWHMGYSASAPLFVATPGNAMESLIGGLIPVTDTVLTPWNIAILICTLGTLAVSAALLHPRRAEDIQEISEEFSPAEESSPAPHRRGGFAGAVENGRWLTSSLGILLILYVGHWFSSRGFQLDLNIVNWTFLAAGLLLARSAVDYGSVLARGGRAVVPFLLQYPMYAGIMGLMLNTGLVAQIAGWFATIGTAQTLPLIAFLSGGVINLFIPSGGAQWAVQGPAFVEAAQQLGTDLPLIVMGVAYGDQWTNIIHPFVVIPLLIMTGLPMAKVLSYSFLFFLIATFPLGIGLYLASA